MTHPALRGVYEFYIQTLSELIWRRNGCVKRRMAELSVSGGQALWITVQKHNFITVVTDLGETGSNFIEKTLFGFPSDILQLLCLNSRQITSLVAKVAANCC